MPRKFDRKTPGSPWTEESMKRAITEVKEKQLSIRHAASQFNVPYSTLQDRLKGRFEAKKLHAGRKRVFSTDQEAEIATTFLSLSKSLDGLTAKKMRQVVYKYAEENQISHCFNKVKEECGKDWLYSFLSRHPELVFQKPNVMKSTTVNKSETDQFFDDLEMLYDKYKFESNKIYNVNETGVTVNWHFSKSGEIIMIICCFSASGQYIPPMFIFNRTKMEEGLGRNGPEGAVYKCSQTGLVSEELFTEWLQHFAKFTTPTPENPVLLILDIYSSHSSLTSYNFCRASGIHLLFIPSRTSQRMQPLDIAFYKPLEKAYQEECEKKAQNDGGVDITDIAELFANAYNRTATAEKGVDGFRATGIFPLNKQVFIEEELISTSETIENPVNAAS